MSWVLRSTFHAQRSVLLGGRHAPRGELDRLHRFLEIGQRVHGREPVVPRRCEVDPTGVSGSIELHLRAMVAKRDVSVIGGGAIQAEEEPELGANTLHPNGYVGPRESFAQSWVCLLYTSPSPRD